MERDRMERDEVSAVVARCCGRPVPEDRVRFDHRPPPPAAVRTGWLPPERGDAA
jgi:hypothetical protein